MIFRVDTYYDKTLKRFAATEFIEADKKEDVKPRAVTLFPYFIVEEDPILEEKALFSGTVMHTYDNGYDDDTTECKGSIYALARSYKEATEIFRERFKNAPYYKSEDHYLGQVFKLDMPAVEILTKLWP